MDGQCVAVVSRYVGNNFWIITMLRSAKYEFRWSVDRLQNDKSRRQHFFPTSLQNKFPISWRRWKSITTIFFSSGNNIGNEEKCRFLCYNQPVCVVADIRAQQYPDNRSQMRVVRCGDSAGPTLTLRSSHRTKPSLNSSSSISLTKCQQINLQRVIG